MKEEIEERFDAGIKQLVDISRILRQAGIEERSNACFPATLAILRPDLVPPEIVAPLMINDFPLQDSSYLEAVPEAKSAFLLYRVTHKRPGVFRHVLKDRGVAGVIVKVPLSYEGVKGSQRRGVIPIESKTHALAVLGKAKDVDPEGYRQDRVLGRKFPERGAKEIRKNCLIVYDPNKEEVMVRTDARVLLKVMSRVSGDNLVVVLKKGYRFDPERRRIVAEKNQPV